ncbi:MAG TPA: hypothetical protein DHV41_02025 [Parachlamydiales bacterium]|nr:hypothetical protein [Parachlamydiales bacterium]
MAAKIKDLNTRLLFSTLSTAAVVLLTLFSPLPFMGWLLTCTLALLAGIAVWEYAKLARAKDFKPATFWMIAFAVVEVFSLFAAIRIPALSQLPLFVPFSGLVAFFIIHFKNPSQVILHIALQFFAICYIAIPLGLMLGILFFFSPDLPSFDGRWWFFYLIFVTKITDIGGYFVGRLWGRRRLAPVISPQKTLEGSLAGLFCSVLLSVAFSYLGAAYSQGGFLLPLSHAIWFGALLGILGQVGDLAESLLKRDALVKDSNALPGIGGILDLIDSLLLTTPLVYFYIRTFL